MAKYVAKSKDKQLKVVIHPEKTGKLGTQDVTLAHDKATGRYNLKIGGKLNVSSFRPICLHRAEDKGVVWS